ncbi:hypothetical protein A6D98_09890 [Aliivibrio fischeri]|uniref:hypothetical protein n=1 Tax=Aliivibrio fischeri TaxID=668 RepID=UPI00080EC4C6|nr:hypothetical protein [Aliivibrio fischeri]OCH60901.1 hypothetical protein A6D98_09890 [Aliivibrio fischeri]
MIKKTIMAFMLIGLVSGCVDQDKKWLLEGNVNGLNRHEWQNAYPDLKLGTAGRWLQTLHEKGFLNNDDLIEGPEFKENAKKLSECLDSSMLIYDKPTNQLVASCVKMMGFAD